MEAPCPEYWFGSWPRSPSLTHLPTVSPHPIIFHGPLSENYRVEERYEDHLIIKLILVSECSPHPQCRMGHLWISILDCMFSHSSNHPCPVNSNHACKLSCCRHDSDNLLYLGSIWPHYFGNLIYFYLGYPINTQVGW